MNLRAIYINKKKEWKNERMKEMRLINSNYYVDIGANRKLTLICRGIRTEFL